MLGSQGSHCPRTGGTTWRRDTVTAVLAAGLGERPRNWENAGLHLEASESETPGAAEIPLPPPASKAGQVSAVNALLGAGRGGTSWNRQEPPLVPPQVRAQEEPVTRTAPPSPGRGRRVQRGLLFTPLSWGDPTCTLLPLTGPGASPRPQADPRPARPWPADPRTCAPGPHTSPQEGTAGTPGEPGPGVGPQGIRRGLPVETPGTGWGSDGTAGLRGLRGS